MLTLADLNPGEKAAIRAFRQHDRAYCRRLLAMGLTPRTPFQVIRKAPLGDPIEIRVRNFYLSLRREEAIQLEIEQVET